MSRRARERKRTKIIFIVSSVVLFMAIVAAIVLLVMSGDSEAKCGICKKILVKNTKYCDTCKNDYTCENCGSIEKSTVNGFCDSCAAVLPKCEFCQSTVKTGVYCDECYYDMIEKEKRICYLCNESIVTAENVTFITKDHRVYCVNCDTGFYCESCGGIIEENDDDAVCFMCSDLYCMECKEVLTEEENVSKYETIGLCSDCDTGKYCSECGRVLQVSDDDSVCYQCSECFCFNCKEVLNLSEVSYTIETETKENTQHYCRECDTENYCIECKEPIEIGKTLCSKCE